jgi:hypothetical protein
MIKIILNWIYKINLSIQVNQILCNAMLNKWWVSLRTCYIVHSKAAHIIAKFKTDYHKNGISVISSVLGFKLNINNYK